MPKTTSSLRHYWIGARIEVQIMTDYKTETVFVSGSLSVTELSEFAKAHVRSIATSRINVLIGDAYGADKLIQQELKNVYDYPFVTVYASNGKARNNIGNYKVKAIDVPTGIYGREFYTYKDVAMSNDCDFGFMLWDSKSNGTLNNIRRLIGMNKLSIVCLSYTRKSYKIETEQQLDKMLRDIKGE